MSQRVPALKPKDVLRLLEREGFVVHHVSGSHYVLEHPHKKGPEARHAGFYHSTAGYTTSEFLDLLK
jgi:hypothetical protein